MMLSLPEDWNYTTRGLAAICKEGVDAIGGALRELEDCRVHCPPSAARPQGRIVIPSMSYTSKPQPKNPDTPQPDTASPDTENPDMVKPDTEKPAELNIEKSNTEKTITYTDQVPILFPSGSQRQHSCRNGKEGMRCLSQRWKVIGI